MTYRNKNKAYEGLIVYWLAMTIYDLTVIFCKTYMTYKTYKLYTRTYDQMVQAARSGKQNIVEGWLEKSFEGTLKLLGVARASFWELKEDLFDYLRQNNLSVWNKEDSRILEIRRTIDLPYKTYTSYTTYKKNLGNDEALANLIITLCSKESFLLDRLIKSVEEKFIREGGFRENLFKKRREWQKQERNTL